MAGIFWFVGGDAASFDAEPVVVVAVTLCGHPACPRRQTLTKSVCWKASTGERSGTAVRRPPRTRVISAAGDLGDRFFGKRCRVLAAEAESGAVMEAGNRRRGRRHSKVGRSAVERGFGWWR